MSTLFDPNVLALTLTLRSATHAYTLNMETRPRPAHHLWPTPNPALNAGATPDKWTETEPNPELNQGTPNPELNQGTSNPRIAGS
jgi:hypothetical protein